MAAVKNLQALVFRILGMILWLAPIGAFGAVAAVVGKTGFAAIVSLGILMIAFYITCAVFVFAVLGSLLHAVTRVNILSLMKYLGREYLLIVGTSSSESALPRLIAKMEHLGVSKPVVGITVPTGYSFNLDIASGMGVPMSIPEQIGLLVFMVIASKGAAGVTGAGLATLAGGLQAFRPDLVNGVGVVATLLIGTWTRQIDREQVQAVLSGRAPFDEATLAGDDHGGLPEAPAPEQEQAAVRELHEAGRALR